MPVLSFSEYRPDVSDYNGQTTKNVLNVVPRGDGYGPFPALSAYSGALAAANRGYFYARNNDGTISAFAGTSTKLYKLDNTALTWSDVSLGAGSYAALGATANWQFAQFNKYVFASQGNEKLQIYSLTTSTAFADRADTNCMNAAYVTVVNKFLVLSGGTGTNAYRIQWSGLNDVSSASAFTSGTNSSDFQDFSDGGIVRPVSGGEYGVVFQDQSIRRMIYAPGSPVIFTIDRIAIDDGIYAPYSIVRAGDRIFWLSSQGFKTLIPGGSPKPIGKEKVDRTFFADVDTGNLQLVIGAQDPRNSRIFWAYKSIEGASGLFDKILCYDWVLDKWSTIQATGEYIGSLSSPGITLENVDTIYGSNIDTLTNPPSFDSIPTSGTPAISAFDSNHKLGFFTGSNLEATMETPEQSGDGRRFFVRAMRVVSDASAINVSVSKRENPYVASTYSTETVTDATGQAPSRVSTRYGRAKIRITSGSTWTYAAGVEPEFTPEGQR